MNVVITPLDTVRTKYLNVPKEKNYGSKETQKVYEMYTKYKRNTCTNLHGLLEEKNF